MVVMDQKYVDLHGGNISLAHMKANAQVDNAVITGNGSLESLNNVDRPLRSFYNLTFKKIFSPLVLAPPKGVESTTGWCDKIDDYYRDLYPCMKFDCIVVCTGEFGTGFDFGYAPAKVVLLGGSANSKEIVAHEIGHILGLIHMQVPDCCTNNEQTNTMMCQPLGKRITLNGNIGCQSINFMNNNVFTTNIVNGNCKLWADTQPLYNSDFTCPPVSNIQWFLEPDNPNPVIGCKTDGDIVTIEVTLVNNNSQANRNIRASISDTDKDVVEFLEDPSLDFNCKRIFTNSRIEMRIVNTVAASCEDEKTFPLAPGESKVVKLKIRYKGGISYQSSPSSFAIRLYTGDNISFNNKDIFIFPFVEKNGGNISNGYDAFNPVLVNGTLLLNNATPLVIGEGSISNKLLFKPGASLEIASGSVVKMKQAVLEGCSTMWKGITVRQGGSLEISMMSKISDAQDAVGVQRGGVFKATDSYFINNNFGVKTLPNGSGVYDMQLSSVHFGTDEAGLKPAYGGQNPPPVANIGFAGLYLKDAGSITLQGASASDGNKFFKLHSGILTKNTNVLVRNTTFEEINQNASVPVLQDFPTFSSGRAIHAVEGALNVVGGGIAPEDAITFNNCHTGVSALNTTLSVNNCKLRVFDTGINTLTGYDKVVSITSNDIVCDNRGIGLFHLSAAPGASIVSDNLIEVKAALGTGVISGHFIFNNQEGGVIAKNKITLSNGLSGIDLGNVAKMKVVENDLTLTTPSNKYGISVLGGFGNAIRCNKVIGPGENGIFANQLSNSSISCNIIENAKNALRFEGASTGNGDLSVGGNYTSNIAVNDLLLGVDAVIGEQRHKGNIWDNSNGNTIATHLGGLVQAFESIFFVDPNVDARFLPTFILPTPWFKSEGQPGTSFQCISNVCIPAITLPVISSDLPILNGSLEAELNFASQIWETKRRLYKKLSLGGASNGTNAQISAFINQANSNGIKEYHDVRATLESAFYWNSIDSMASLSMHNQVVAGLNQLASIELSLLARGLSYSDSLTLSIARNSLKQTLTQLDLILNNKRSVDMTLQAQGANQSKLQNTSLAANTIFQGNEKSINNILSNFVLSERLDISNTDKQQLIVIANQCPLVGGRSVLLARTLLQYFSNTPNYFDDDTLCNSVNLRDDLKTVSRYESLTCYPNPANTLIVFDYHKHSPFTEKIQIFNELGALVIESDIFDLQGTVSFQTQNWTAGLYYYVSGNMSGKFIVSH
jgi:hypothetical protein